MKATLLSQHYIQKKESKTRSKKIYLLSYKLFVKEENANIETEWKINNLNHLRQCQLSLQLIHSNWI